MFSNYQNQIPTLVLHYSACLPHLQSLRGTTQVIRALYKVHRSWELKELNLRSRALLSKYFSPELTNLCLKNAQLKRDCPKGDLCGLDSSQFSELRTSTTTSTLSLTSPRQRRRKQADSKHLSNYLTKRHRSKSKTPFPTCSGEKRMAHRRHHLPQR